jgi:deazaflavin-dependent oxidoreductase (nitroreductase family)
MPVNPTVRKFFARAHTFVYRATGGKLGSSIRGVPIVLLTTTGRSSGRPRTTPLQSIEDGENIIVIASNGGHKVDPQWWLNLKSDPEASLRIGGRDQRVHGEEAVGDERERLWAKALKQFPNYAGYEKTAERQLPIVILSPG